MRIARIVTAAAFAVTAIIASGAVAAQDDFVTKSGGADVGKLLAGVLR